MKNFLVIILMLLLSPVSFADPIEGHWVCGTAYADPSGDSVSSNAGVALIDWCPMDEQGGIGYMDVWNRAAVGGYLKNSSLQLVRTLITDGVYRVTIGDTQTQPGPREQFYQVILTPDGNSLSIDMLVKDADSQRGGAIYTGECQRVTEDWDEQTYRDFLNQWVENP